MLPGLGFWEFFVLAVVALIVVGPRDLPRMAKTIGGYVRQARGFAKEFQKSFEEMGREIELDELRKEVEAIKRGEPFDDISQELKSIERDVRSVDRDVTAPPAPSKAGEPAASTTTAAPAPSIAPPQPASEPAEESEPAAPTPLPERSPALKSQSGG